MGLSWDAIAFNTKGELINGQHRLSGLIEANTSCEFFVIRDLPHKTAQYSDNGRNELNQNVSLLLALLCTRNLVVYKKCFTDFKGKD